MSDTVLPYSVIAVIYGRRQSRCIVVPTCSGRPNDAHPPSTTPRVVGFLSFGSGPGRRIRVSPEVPRHGHSPTRRTTCGCLRSKQMRLETDYFLDLQLKAHLSPFSNFP